MAATTGALYERLDRELKRLRLELGARRIGTKEAARVFSLR